MSDPSEIYFECSKCERSFRKTIFSLDRRCERVEFEMAGRTFDVDDFEGLTIYCSEQCMRVHFPKEMAVQAIPIPQRRPGVGPVEVCALCKGPVDMTRHHFAFRLDKWQTPSGERAGKTLWDEYVAVMCNTCSPTGLE